MAPRRESRVSLICASLEPGRDGVGDYTSRLARALGAQGVRVTRLALADRHVRAPSGMEGPSDLVRLPAALPSATRSALAAAVLDAWAPAWVSLQLVSWDHGWNGVVLGEADRLARLLHGRRLQVMLHETWITPAHEATASGLKRLRRAALGLAQRRSIARLLRRLRPTRVDTSNAVYQRQLAGLGVAAGQLPLFGGIDPAPPGRWADLRALAMERAGIDLGEDRADVALLGIFGALRPAPVEAALGRVVEAVAPRRAVLLALGDGGAEAEARLAQLAKAAPGLAIGRIGPLDESTLSRCLGHLDAALSLHPAALVGRSGAAAALLEHGVPVITPWGRLPPPGDCFADAWRDLLWPDDEHLAGRLAHPPPRRRRPGGADRVAAALIEAMAECRRGDQSAPDPTAP